MPQEQSWQQREIKNRKVKDLCSFTILRDCCEGNEEEFYKLLEISDKSKEICRELGKLKRKAPGFWKQLGGGLIKSSLSREVAEANLIFSVKRLEWEKWNLKFFSEMERLMDFFRISKDCDDWREISEVRERVKKRQVEENKEMLEDLRIARETGISQERIKEILAELEEVEGNVEKIISKLEKELNQEKQAHRKTKQDHTNQLNQILKILGTTTTNTAPLTSPGDNSALVNLVKEQATASQEKITHLEAKISETEQELAQVRSQEANKTAKIEQIETKLTELGNAKSEAETKLIQETQSHHDHLQELFEILRPTTGFLNLDNLNGDNITYDLVKEQVQSCQEEKASLWQEIEDLEAKFQAAVVEINNYKIATNSLKDQCQKTKNELKNSRATRKINLNFFATILNKQKELKKLEDLVKSKLENQSLLENLLTNQEILTNSQLTNTPERVIKLITSQLTQIKSELAKKIASEEINQLCQVKHHLVELERELENLLPMKVEAKIEIRQSGE